MSSCCQLQLNPDITGIGVRAALYAQIMLGWVMSLVWPDTFVKNSRTAYMTAIALLIASFIQLRTQSLSLLDGLVVSLTTSMMITFAIASYPSRRKATESASNPSRAIPADAQSSKTRSFMHFCFVIFWAAWCFNMWRDPAHFGLKSDQASCLVNYNVTIWVFGHDIHPTDSGMQNAAIALVSIGFVIALGSLFLTLEQFMAPILFAINKFKAPENPESAARAPAYDDPIVQGAHVILQTWAIATLIYLTISTERTILSNDLTHQSNNWSYGQTIALILLLQQVMDIFSTYVEKQEEAEVEAEKIAHQRGDVPGEELRELPGNR